MLTKVGDENGEGNVEGDEVVTESYIFLDKDDLDLGEWDFAAFKRDKLGNWTGPDVEDGECVCEH